MNKFILQKLTVSGGNHEDSIIEFIDGLNLIIGPSNTGKSLIMDCIDYAFGFTPRVDRPSKIVDNNEGYTHVKLSLKTKNGIVVLEREIGTNKIIVNSTDPKIESDTYSSSSSSKKNISNVLLKLIGIDNEHKILSSQKGKTQKLTWRTILHLFFMKQTPIARETSALLMPDPRGKTSSAAALLYLLTGKDASKLNKPEDPEISKAKRDAIIMYIRNKKDQLSQRKEILEQNLIDNNIDDIKNTISSINKEINTIQKDLDIANSKSKKLMQEIYHQNGKLSECNTILYNFEVLYNQYKSDINRLEFIIDGQIASIDLPSNKQCPFCNAKLDDKPSENYIASATAELSKIQKHIYELEEARNTANNKKVTIENKISTLEEEKQNLDNHINSSIKPKLSTFKEELNKNMKIIRWQNELDIIRQNELDYGNDLFEKETEEDPSEMKFNIFSSFDYELIHEFENELISALESSNIGGASNARLNMKSFDIEIDNNSKATSMGGGYCAILNTLTAYAMGTYIFKKNGYSPRFFAIDSALTQLSEPDYITKDTSVKYNFMNYMISNALDRQVIMIEQKDEIPYIPEEDLNKGVHIIEFTNDITHGRYGFLNDVVNSKDK